MNAHKFVAEKGIDEAKRVLKKAPHSASLYRITPQGNCLYYKIENHEYQVYFPLSDEWWMSSIQESSEFSDLSELKQVVESLDTIDRLFGLDQAKHTMKIAKEIGYTSDYEQIKQAIADYELVDSFKYGALTNKGTKCEVLNMVDVSPRCEVRNG